MPNVKSKGPRPDNMNETVPHTSKRINCNILNLIIYLRGGVKLVKVYQMFFLYKTPFKANRHMIRSNIDFLSRVKLFMTLESHVTNTGK